MRKWKQLQRHITNRECSVQKAVYLVMPELFLHETFPGAIFLNSNLPENSIEFLKRNLRLVNYQMIALTFFSIICLIAIWIGQMKIIRMKIVPLMYSREKLKIWKVEAVFAFKCSTFSIGFKSFVLFLFLFLYIAVFWKIWFTCKFT